MPFIASLWGDSFVPTPLISAYLPGMSVMPAGDPLVAWQLGAIFKGFFLSGAFPVFPWLLFSILGFVLGREIVKGKFAARIPAMIFIGVLLVALAFAGAYAGSLNDPASITEGFISPFCFYPVSFTMILFQTGMGLFWASILFWIYDAEPRKRTKFGFFAKNFKRTSNFSLSFCFLHWLLVGWPLALIYFFTGRCPVADFGHYPSLLCGMGALIILGRCLKYWERVGAKYNL